MRTNEWFILISIFVIGFFLVPISDLLEGGGFKIARGIGSGIGLSMFTAIISLFPYFIFHDKNATPANQEKPRRFFVIYLKTGKVLIALFALSLILKQIN